MYWLFCKAYPFHYSRIPISSGLLRNFVSDFIVSFNRNSSLGYIILAFKCAYISHILILQPELILICNLCPNTSLPQCGEPLLWIRAVFLKLEMNFLLSKTLFTSLPHYNTLLFYFLLPCTLDSVSISSFSSCMKPFNVRTSWSSVPFLCWVLSFTPVALVIICISVPFILLRDYEFCVQLPAPLNVL